jgi:hypothetical protein
MPPCGHREGREEEKGLVGLEAEVRERQLQAKGPPGPEEAGRLLPGILPTPGFLTSGLQQKPFY